MMKRLLLMLFIGAAVVANGQCSLSASFTYSINGGTIDFTNTSTNEPANAFYDWNYGSQFSSQENPTLNAELGWNTACLTVYDSTWTCFDSVCVDIYVDSIPGGGCNLNTSFSYVHNGSTIDFINTSTGEPAGAMYDWWYNGQSSGMENPTLNAATTDEYACLTVYDSTWSCYDSICVLIYADTTGGTGCNLSTGFTYVHNGSTVDFTDISTGVPAGATYDWWYNGQSSNQQNPTFTAATVDDYACLTIYDSSWTCYDSICFMVYVDSTGGGGGDSTVSVVEVVETTFDVYPNPASSEINVSVKNGNGYYTVNVIDLTGRIVLETELTGNQTTIDITTLESGGYLLYMIDQKSPDNFEVVKILKE